MCGEGRGVAVGFVGVDAFERGDLGALDAFDRGLAGDPRLSVDDHGAAAALA